MSYVKMNGMWDDIKNSILPDSTTPTTTTQSPSMWDSLTSTLTGAVGTGAQSAATPGSSTEIAETQQVTNSNSSGDWLSKVLGFSATLLKPNQTASPLPTITIQQSPFPIVPVIAVGGVALVAVLLLTKKKK